MPCGARVGTLPRPTAASTRRSCACTKSSFVETDVVAFSEGRIARVLRAGLRPAPTTHTRTPKIQSGRSAVHRPDPDFEPGGGPWGRGFMRCETAIAERRVVLRRALQERSVHARQLHGRGLCPGPVVLPRRLRLHRATRRVAFPADAGPPVRAEVPRRDQPADASSVAYEVHVEELWSGPHPTVDRRRRRLRRRPAGLPRPPHRRRAGSRLAARLDARASSPSASPRTSPWPPTTTASGSTGRR